MTGAASLVAAGVLWAERLPGPTYESPTEGSPGFAGFVATFVLALAVIALAVSFTRRMRRAAHRDRLRAEEAAAPDAGTPTDAAPAGPAVTGAPVVADPADPAAGRAVRDDGPA